MVIRDFKTSRSAWPSEKAEKSAAQLRLYGNLANGLADPAYHIDATDTTTGEK